MQASVVYGLSAASIVFWFIYVFCAFIVKYRKISGTPEEIKVKENSQITFTRLKHICWFLSMLFSASLLSYSMKDRDDSPTRQDWASAISSGLAWLMAGGFYFSTGYFWEPVALTLVSILSAMQVALSDNAKQIGLGQLNFSEKSMSYISTGIVGLCLGMIILVSKTPGNWKSTSALSLIVAIHFVKIAL